MELPEPLESVLPDTAVPIHELRALEERDDVVHIVILLPIETGFGTVSERFMIQYVDAGYILENIPEQGWKVIEQIDGADKSETELLAALASEARNWHAEIADIAAAASGWTFDEAGIEAMNATLNQGPCSVIDSEFEPFTVISTVTAHRHIFYWQCTILRATTIQKSVQQIKRGSGEPI